MNTQAKKTLRHHSAEARIQRLDGRVVEAVFFGAINAAAFDQLRTQIIEASQDAASMVIRLDRALILSIARPAAPSSLYGVRSIPASLIVSEDQLKPWTDYARLMMMIGVRRLVFSSSQASLAYDFAHSQAAAAHQ